MEKTNKVNRRRLIFTFLLVCISFSAVVGKLVIIQFLDNERYLRYASNQVTKETEIKPERGSIYDRNMMKLAYSVTTYTLWATPSKIENPIVVAEQIASVIDVDMEELIVKLGNKDKKMVKVAEDVPNSKAKLIISKYYPTIWSDVSKNKRIYPYNNFAAQTIGITTHDGRGIAGVEQSYNDELTGKSGKKIAVVDAKRNELTMQESKTYEAQQGLGVVLTVDEVIQHFTEKAVKKGLEDTKAKKVMAIVMDPRNGDILSIVSKPDFNPNDPRDLTDLFTKEEIEAMTNQEKVDIWSSLWRNPIISDTYEPGSTSKILTAAIGLEENVVTPNSTFYDKGYVIVDRVKLHCWRSSNPHGLQTLTQGLENSCNPVFIEVSAKLGKERMYNYLGQFGMFEKTGIDLPAEARPLYQKVEDIVPVELATISYGHGMSVTPLHMVASISAVANKGVLVQPRIVKALIDQEGNIVEEMPVKEIRQVISQKTSAQMLKMMESVVLHGSGKKAYIPGIRIGGKTGTTEKIVNGKYDGEKAYSSFIGVAPIDNPQITVLVVVDEPETSIFGSVVAAPIAHEILVETLRYLGVEPTDTADTKTVIVPDLVGKTYQQAEDILKAADLEFSTVPITADDKSMYVTNQFPLKGTKTNNKSTVVLYFE